MSGKVNILFPIETINRELDYRLYLAALTADTSNRILVGSESALFQIASTMNGGLYVGKNYRPTSLPEDNKNFQRYLALKKQNIKVVWLDEEGGVFWGQPEEWKWTMLQNIDPLQLQPDDQICAWGDTQRDFYRSVHPDFSAQIQTTGHPRFDLYKPHYRQYYEKDVRALRERLGDFVLINTNFHRAYTAQNLKKIFGKKVHGISQVGAHGEAVERWQHLLHIFGDFIKLVSRLQQEFPDLNWVIRPHPSEDPKFYQNIFNEISNVHVLREGAVGPWLLACRAMIHDGCTTAIESHFCNTPIINYKPLADERFDCILPNQFGVRCTDEHAVKNYLQSILKKSNVETVKSIVNPENQSVEVVIATASHLIENFRRDSFPILVEIIEAASAQIPPNKNDVLQGFGNRMQQGKLQTFKQILRRDKTAREAEERSTLSEKFYGFNRAIIAAKIQIIQSMLNKEIRYSQISNELICIEG